MPKVSIITTCYNHKDYIWKTIESVINQSFTDRELLIWDDSPNNDTWKVIQQYVKKYPNKIHARHHEENKGITRNMEFLISKSKWEYIAVLEWDDMFAKNCLKKKLDIFENNPEVMLVYSDLSIIDANWNITQTSYLRNNKRVKLFYKIEYINKEKFFNSYNIPYFSRSTLMFKKDILSKIKICVDWMSPYNIISDYNFFLEVWVSYPIYWIEEDLTKYRFHENNLTKNWNFRLIFDLYNLFSVYKKTWFISNSIRKNISTRYLRVICYESLKTMISISPKESLKNFFKYIYEKIF